MAEGRSLRTSARIRAEPGTKRKYSETTEEKDTPSKVAKTARATKNARRGSKHAPAKSATPEPPKPVLPVNLLDNTPLPVLKKPQPDDLKEEDWQSVPDSGVFAASLKRARQAIIRGTYFERFWTKPVASKKQKDMTEQEKAEFKLLKGPSLSKIGSVSITSEPLTIEAMLYMVKDPNPGHRQGQLPPNSHHIIFGTPRPTIAHAQHYRPAPVQTPVRPPSQITPSPARPVPPTQVARPAQIQVPPSQLATPQPPPNRTSTPVQRPQNPTPAPKPASTPAPAANAQAPDPVIHALAQRASNNPELKAIMKIVATGKASPEQLTYFQRHIDELTTMVRRKQDEEARAKKISQPAPVKTESPVVTKPEPPAAKSDSQSQNPSPAQPALQNATPGGPQNSAPSQPATPAQVQTTPLPAAQPPSNSTPQPQSQAPPVAAPSPAPQAQQPIQRPAATATPPAPAQPVYRPPPTPAQQVPPTRPQPTPAAHWQQPHQQFHHHQGTPYTPPQPEKPKHKTVTTQQPLHVLIQFAENANERFLFPKYSILEFNKTLTEVIVSFLVVKRKPDPLSKDPVGKEIWTPVTLTFKSDAPSLSLLGRVVEPADVVRRYMEDVMVRCEREDEGWLAFRLPREEGVLAD